MADSAAPAAPAAAPAPAPAAETTRGTGTAGGLIDPNDVEDWKNRFNAVMADKEMLKSASPAGARPWTNSYFACCTPVDTCLITCCLPCVTFGKVHHRTRKNGSMQGYEAVNTSCLGFFLSSFVCLHWAMLAMQRADIRQKYNLQGDCITDIVSACCCGCCDIVQQEKETEMLEKQGGASQYSNKENTMAYPPTS